MSKKKVDVELLQPSIRPARYKFLLDNHKKLLKIMKDVTDAQHRQGVWAVDEPANVCGTAACALGWAVLSGDFDGLRYCYYDGEYYPVVNGGYVTHNAVYPLDNGVPDYTRVGEAYFGLHTTRYVFHNARLSKETVVLRLRECIWCIERHQRNAVAV